jgi:hypothetical protein
MMRTMDALRWLGCFAVFGLVSCQDATVIDDKLKDASADSAADTVSTDDSASADGGTAEAANADGGSAVPDAGTDN